MVKFIHKFDLRKSLKIHWHKAKVSNHQNMSKLKNTNKEDFEKRERF